MMLWIGLTGGIASGKSTVSDLLRARGFPIVDADQLVRELSQVGMPALSEIRDAFGPTVFAKDGSLDRKHLGELVFKNPDKRRELEKILHPKVRQLAFDRRQSLAAAGIKAAFYDVPLLFEQNMQAMFDRTVVVHCRRELQLQRIMQRNGISQEEAELRLNAQLPLNEKARIADDVIENGGTMKDLEQAVERYLMTL